MKLSQMDGSPPRTEDVGSLVTLTITTYVNYAETPNKQKLDLDIPQTGIIPFRFQLSDKIVSSTSASLNVRVDFLLLAASN